MKNVIRKIFENEVSEEVHSDFLKFGKGIFKDRYLIQIKRQKSNWSIKTSYEFANLFVRAGMMRAREPVNVKGIIVSTMDIDKAGLPVTNVKKYIGVKQAVLDGEVDPKKIIELMEKYPRAFYAISFSVGDYDLKVRAKPPKSGKPGNKAEEPKADFCALKTSDEDIVGDLIFEGKKFTEAYIKHQIEINDIVLPKGETVPEKIREMSRRKGTLRRILKFDNVESESKKDFLV